MTVACGGHGPNSYLMSKDAVMAKLSNAERQYSEIGELQRTVRASGWNGDTLRLRITTTGGAVTPQSCQAFVEAIDEKWTRVTPSCSARQGESAATSNAISEVFAMHVDEFVIAVLHNREVDAGKVLRRTSAIAIDNIDELQTEARDMERAVNSCLLYTSPSPRDRQKSRMPSSA